MAMIEIKHPSGATMIARTIRVKDKVKDILKTWPSTRGDDVLLVYRYLRRYHPDVRLSAAQFEALLFIPSFETITRRRREVQIEYPDLRPTDRVTGKRKRNERATSNYYGKGLTLADYDTGD